MDFTHFDARRYPTLGVRDGYGEWARTYEDTVLDEMDLRLLARAREIPWDRVRRVVDLACGTGRTAAWLRERGVAHITGVDLTPQMLERARARGAHDRLVIADVADTGLAAGEADLAIQSLADEHLAELGPLYREAARLTSPDGWFVLVGFHPFILMSGIPTHFDRAPGESVAIESWVHLFSDHVRAAHAAGWRLAELDEGLVDDAWIARKPKWARYRNRPVSFLAAWRKDAPSTGEAR